MKKCSPLGILLGDSVSVLLKAIQKSNRIAHHVRWRSWHGGHGVGMEGRFLLVSTHCTPVVVHDQSDSFPDSIVACEGVLRAKCS